MLITKQIYKKASSTASILLRGASLRGFSEISAASAKDQPIMEEDPFLSLTSMLDEEVGLEH